MEGCQSGLSGETNYKRQMDDGGGETTQINAEGGESKSRSSYPCTYTVERAQVLPVLKRSRKKGLSKEKQSAK